MKGYLKSAQGIFLLAPKVTTIGREGCDLVIQSSSVDQQHALLEYLPEEECFVLQDLNSVHGTYVNDCQVENVSIRLCHGDLIRFGKSPVKHELIVNEEPRVSYLPLTSQTAWAQPLTLLQDETSRPDPLYARGGLPHLKTIVSTTTQFATHPPSAPVGPPRPPQTMRSRPLSAGSRRQYLDRTPHVGSQKMPKGTSGWVTGNTGLGVLQRSSSSSDLLALQEKEQKQLQMEEDLRRLEEELQRMLYYEGECHRKDAVVDQLYKEIGALQQRLRVAEARRVPAPLDSDINQKLRVLEREVAAKKEEVNDLRNKINAMQRGSDSGNLTYRADDLKEVQRLKEELLQAHSERNSTHEYVRRLEQQLLSSKDNDSRLPDKELEDLIHRLRSKECEVKELTEQLGKLHLVEDDLRQKVEKIIDIEKRLRETEATRDEQVNNIASLKEEMDEKTRALDGKLKDLQSLQEELEQERVTIGQLNIENRQKQNEIADVSAKLDNFQTQLGLIISSSEPLASGANENEALEAIRKVAEDRHHYQKEIEVLEKRLSEKEQLRSGYEKLKADLQEVLTTLAENGCLSRELKLELAAIHTKSYVSESEEEMKDLFVRLLEIQLNWEEEIETALVRDLDLQGSSGPVERIATLVRKLLAAEGEVTSLRSRLEESEELHRIDLEVALDALREDLTKTHDDHLGKFKQECEEKLAAEIRAEESAIRDEALAREASRLSELQLEIDHLKSEVTERETLLQEKSTFALMVDEEMNSYKQMEADLRQKINDLEKLNSESDGKLRREMDEKTRVHRDEICEYEEQIRQHALTICAMEERLNLAATRHKEFQEEILALKSDITTLQSKQSQTIHQPGLQPGLQNGPQNGPLNGLQYGPQNGPLNGLQYGPLNGPLNGLQPSPPQTMQPSPSSLKPRVLVHSPDVSLIQQTLVQVQRENDGYQKQLQEQQDCILALRRDLAGATARLTDVSGELSEEQKREVEQYRVKIKQLEMEITSQQQQMVKLSDIIDKQSAELKGLTADASKQKSVIGKYKNKINDREARLKEAEAEITRTRSELTKQESSLIDQETSMSSELSLQGAQCRGERHEQVIARQREALAELRAKLRAIEQGDVPLLTKDEALQQLVVLRNELEELKAIQSTRQQVDQTFGNMADCLDVTQMSTLREISENFELSENLYLSLLRGVANSLELDQIAGMRSLLNLPKDERMRLAEERQRTCEYLTNSIKALRDRVYRKDELLQGYERDLAKLRHAEDLTEVTSGQVQTVMDEVREKTEELQCVRESLRRTKERLEQEKRLNTAIKHKKTHHLENEPITRNGWPKHYCLQPDAQADLYAKRKLQNEKKRRQYEKELKVKESEIAHRRRLLAEQDNQILEIS